MLSLPERNMLIAAIALRVITCAVLGPSGSDNHYEVIEAILREGHLPMAHLYAQAFHPPAYYLLSLPWAILGGARGVEVFSLLLSVANVWLLFGLLRRVIEDDRARLHAMALVAFLPQFVLYAILVSNDTLAMFAGTLALLAALRYQSDPRPSNAALAGLAAALGLLTKGTLIGHAAVLFLVILAVERRRPAPADVAASRAATPAFLFLSLALLLGSYKYVENQLRYGTPFVHNMDFQQRWAEQQRPTITGARSLIDIDITRLLREPYAERREGGWTNPRSVPLLFYASFWHPYTPVSNFRGSWQWTPLLAQATYVLAIPATLLILAGLLIAIRRRQAWIPLAFLAANFAIVMAAGVKYDAWSNFQSRLFFPSMAAIAFAYAWGIARSGRFARFVDGSCIALYALFLTYFAFEIAFVVMKTLGA